MRLNTKCLYELIIHFVAFINLRYNELGQLEYVQRDDRSFLTQIDYIYDHERNLFLKRSDYGGKLREIHQIDGSYRIYTLKDREVHEIIFNKESEILGHFRFSGRHHLAMNPSMYYNRMLAGIKRLFIKSSYKDIASLMGALYYITDNTKAMLEQIDTKEIKYLYERQKEANYYFIMLLLFLLTIYIIYQNNQHYENEYSYLMQLIAFVLIIIFYQSCIPRPEKRPKIEYALLGHRGPAIY
ncbi:MAG: hypothetical protein KatS3mg129_2317 [Leptospiraceae bacterium]|nr:MAG: hypothetical protein KatS3mg129_2317 [Leptospiraceae bacterium]